MLLLLRATRKGEAATNANWRAAARAALALTGAALLLSCIT